MSLSWKLVIDSRDANSLADFWAAALEYEREDYAALLNHLLREGLITEEEHLTEHDGQLTWRDFAGVRHTDDPVDPATGIGLGRRLLFQNVPEEKVAKNRLHIDIQVAHGDPEKLAALVERLRSLGASAVREVNQGPAGHWWIMKDPEGNEFCAA